MADVDTQPQEQEEVEAPETEAEAPEAPESASAEEPEPEPEGQAEEAAEPGDEPPAEPVAETPEEPETEPFGFTADRRRFEVPGAALVRFKENGQTVEKIVMDRDAWNRHIQPNLRDQAALQRREADFRKEKAALDPERNETVIRAKALLGSLEGVLANEETLTAFLQDFERNKELWQLKAEKAVSDAKLNGYTTQETEQQTQQRYASEAAQIESDIPEVVTGAAQWVTQNRGIEVDQRVLAAAQEQIANNVAAYYRYATPFDAQTYGVEQGSLIRDDDAVISTIERLAKLVAQPDKAQEAKKTNQIALSAGKKPPKTVSAKGSPGAADKPRTFKTKEEWMAYMGGNT